VREIVEERQRALVARRRAHLLQQVALRLPQLLQPRFAVVELLRDLGDAVLGEPDRVFQPLDLQIPLRGLVDRKHQVLTSSVVTVATPSRRCSTPSCSAREIGSSSSTSLYGFTRGGIGRRSRNRPHSSHA
jgi:hypothetical protein